MEKAGISTARKAKEKGRTTKGLPKAKVIREKASQRMARKANPRKEQTKAKAKVTIDPRERENQTSSALHAVSMATTQRTVGRTNKCVPMPQGSNPQPCDASVAQQSVVQGSPSSSAGASFTHLTSVSNQVPQVQFQQASQPVQHRVARIVEDNCDEMVFDLTGSAFGSGNVRTIHFYIGDSDDV